MTRSDPTSETPPELTPGLLRWPGAVLVALAAAAAVATIDVIRLDEHRANEARRAQAIATAIATEIESPSTLTPEMLARFEALSGGSIRARGPGMTITREGVIERSRANTGVQVPNAPEWRIDVTLPPVSTARAWVDAALAGGLAGLVSGLIGRRFRRDARRLRRDLDGLVRQEATAGAGATRRVSIPETITIADAVRPLNELLAAISSRLESSESDRGRQSLVIESMASGVLVLDRDGAIDTANSAARRLLQITKASPSGIPLSEAVRDSELHDMVAAAIDTRQPQRRVFRSAGSTPSQPQELATAVAPIVDRRGRAESPRLDGVVILVEDATYLRRLERARTDFVGNVSHELRTPITNLLGYIETAIELDDDDRETRLKFLEVAQRNARRLASIIEDLLSLASLEASGGRLERDPVRLAPLLDRIAERHRTAAPDGASRDIEVECDPAMELMGAATLLDQAIDNLVSNALRYGRPDGTIRIEAGREEGGTRITVVDEGPGIPPRHLPRIFERFYRVDTARSRQEGGTGLGLAIVKHIAAAHDGTAEAESTVGVGSRFTIRIPDPTGDPTSDPTSDPGPSGTADESTVRPRSIPGQAELTGLPDS